MRLSILLRAVLLISVAALMQLASSCGSDSNPTSSGGGGNKSTATPTVSSTPSVTVTISFTATPTFTPSVTSTRTSSPTPSITASPTRTLSQTGTPTRTLTRTVTPSPTPTCSAGWIGFQTMATVQGPYAGSNRTNARNCALPVRGIISAMSVSMAGTALAGDQMRMAIYTAPSSTCSDASSLVASTAVTTFAAGGVSGWLTLAIGPVTLDPGNYYLAVNKSSANVNYPRSSATGYIYEITSTFGTFPASYSGGSCTNNSSLFLYANYTCP